MAKMSIKIEVNVTVDSIDEANAIAHDLEKILDDNNITNSIIVTDEISY